MLSCDRRIADDSDRADDGDAHGLNRKSTMPVAGGDFADSRRPLQRKGSRIKITGLHGLAGGPSAGLVAE